METFRFKATYADGSSFKFFVVGKELRHAKVVAKRLSGDAKLENIYFDE